MLVTGFINISSFQKNIIESEVVSVVVKGDEFINKIQYALKYGKELDNFYGMNSLLKEWKEQYVEIENASIVLIDGEIVAIDKFPSFTYAEQVWDMIIRDCYGALAIISELKNKSADLSFTETFESMKKSARHQENVVDLIEAALKKTKDDISKSVHDKITEILDLTFDATLDTEGHTSGVRAPNSYILKNEGYIGQVITESEFNHLVSVVRKETFDPNALRAVNELRRKARSQNRFTL